MQEFGKKYFRHTIYINFDNNNKELENIFKDNINVKNILTALEIISNKKITPVDTPIIFGEIQGVPAALKSLKYFYEESPEYYIICADSLLGIAVHSGSSFPVGKVYFLNIYPLILLNF